jgi:hypothetical protein
MTDEGAMTDERADRALAGAAALSALATVGPPAAEVVDATDWPATRWDDLAVRSPGGHAFQSHAWGELKAGGGWQIRRLAIRVAGSEDAWLGVISLQERQIGPWSVRYAPGARSSWATPRQMGRRFSGAWPALPGGTGPLSSPSTRSGRRVGR